MLMLTQLTGFGVRRASGGGGGTDPYFANVILLLGFEGSDGATTLTDESTAANKGSGTANGNAQIDTAQAKFGSGSGLFDGSGDYWTFADHADWNLSGEFTIELFVRRAATGSNTYILGQGDGLGSMAWYLNSTWSAGDNGSLVFAYSINGGLGGNLMVTTGTIPAGTATLNAWHYIAVTRNASGKVRIWFDGTLLAGNTPANLTTFNSSDTLGIGRAVSTAIWNGWMDEIRITKGVCRYDTDGSITVPTAAFPRS